MIFDESFMIEYDGSSVIAEYDGLGRLRRKFLYGTGIDEVIMLADFPQKTDLTDDGMVDVEDLLVLAQAWLSDDGFVNFNRDIDLIADGIINFEDFAVLAGRWPVDATLEDLLVLAQNWLCESNYFDFDPAADLNGDGIINFEDYAILTGGWHTPGRQNGVYFYHYDGLGSVAALSDSAGELVESYEYDVFGSFIATEFTEGTENPYYFTARRYDTESGLYYYRARYYKPSIGRFLQTDPIGYKAGMNLYTYCGNNPIIFTDPHGMDYWVQGKTFGHQQISIGDPKGNYVSYGYYPGSWNIFGGPAVIVEDENMKKAKVRTDIVKTAQKDDKYLIGLMETIANDSYPTNDDYIYVYGIKDCHSFAHTMYDTFNNTLRKSPTSSTTKSSVGNSTSGKSASNTLGSSNNLGIYESNLGLSSDLGAPSNLGVYNNLGTSNNLGAYSNRTSRK